MVEYSTSSFKSKGATQSPQRTGNVTEVLLVFSLVVIVATTIQPVRRVRHQDAKVCVRK